MSNEFLKLSNIKVKPCYTDYDIEKQIRKMLRLKNEDELEFKLIKRSMDSRHKPDIFYNISVEITKLIVSNKKADIKKLASKCNNASIAKKTIMSFPEYTKEIKEEKRPVVIGFGPAGIFCALMLAKAGMKPVVFERGGSIENRQSKVDEFWDKGKLDLECNVLFGEGGAGAFSDGKLNTQINDTFGRIGFVLNTFVQFGANPEILYVNKPHIGTDVLSVVVKNIREYIVSLGGEIHFNSKLTDIHLNNGSVRGIKVQKRKPDNSCVEIIERDCDTLCLAIGHSARDTFRMLNDMKVMMEPKPFAVGVRIEHPQSFINNNAYGDAKYALPAADYKVTYKAYSSGKERGVYSFCMCPGGYVVNASSEENMLAVNGMSYSKRDSSNANSAMIVTVGPEDFGSGVLDGMEYQRKLEENAYKEGFGNIPVQLFSDFKNNRISTGFGNIRPCIKGGYSFGNLNNVLPQYVSSSLIEGIEGVSKLIKGFDMEDAVLSGVESRTSSPLRIIRNDMNESVGISGLFPCGEGAGYAGGITSAAVDGIRIAESIVNKAVL